MEDEAPEQSAATPSPLRVGVTGGAGRLGFQPRHSWRE